MFHVKHRKHHRKTYRKQKIMKSILRRAAVLVALLTLPAMLTVGCTGDDKPATSPQRAVTTVRADNPGPSLAAIDVCQGLTGQMVAACVILGDRPAETSGDVTNPDGIALVGECRGDTALAEDELYACLTQPHLS